MDTKVEQLKEDNNEDEIPRSDKKNPILYPSKFLF